MQENTKLFAFKLTQEVKAQEVKPAQELFKARDGVAVAGCTGPYARGYNYQTHRSDAGIYC